MEDTRFRLDSDFAPDGEGLLTLTLHNFGAEPLTGFRLALTSLFRIRPEATVEGGRLVDQVSNYKVIAPPDGFVLMPGGAWSITADRLSHRLRHYTDGPKSAYLILADGSLETVAVTPMTEGGAAGSPLFASWARVGGVPAGTSLSVVPYPREARISGARGAADSFRLADGPEPAREAFAAAGALAERLFPGDPPLFSATGGLACEARVEGGEKDAYRIRFAPDAITVTAAAREGFFHAFVTLGHILRGGRADPDRFSLPADGEIADRPRFGWRGLMLDVARQRYGAAELLRVADRLAWLKLNRFHLHLTDDEGWRLDIQGYPQLADEAAWRGHGLKVPPLLGSGPAPYGGIYERDDLAGLVRHAADIGVTIVPEIDVPGHCYAVLEALPHLRDPGETGTYRSIQYFPNNALNPAMPETYAFMEAVLSEVAAIFPGPWIHIGGDEVADDAWQGSPLAEALMREREWTGVAQLQAHFMRRVRLMVRALRREVGAWQEAALGGGIDPAGAYLVSWRDSASGLAMARQGYSVVMAPAQHAYLDMARSEAWWEPGASWAGTVSPETTYAYDPGADWPAELLPRILGVQGCLWSENLHDRRLLDHMLFPRLAAIAETGWTPAEAKDLDRFAAIAGRLFRSG